MKHALRRENCSDWPVSLDPYFIGYFMTKNLCISNNSKYHKKWNCSGSIKLKKKDNYCNLAIVPKSNNFILIKEAKRESWSDIFR